MFRICSGLVGCGGKAKAPTTAEYANGIPESIPQNAVMEAAVENGYDTVEFAMRKKALAGMSDEEIARLMRN